MGQEVALLATKVIQIGQEKYQNNQNTALTAPAGDPTAVISTINHSTFIKGS